MIDLIGAVAIAFMVVWFLAVWKLGALDEAHHAWYGLPFAIAEQFPPWLRILGLVAVIDDGALGHVVQLVRPRWQSPLHRLFYRLFPHAP